MASLGRWIDILKNRNAMLYFIGQASSQFGSNMTRVALSLYVLHQTKSAEQFSTVLAVAFLPQMLLYPFSGVIVDRVSRKHLMAFLGVAPSTQNTPVKLIPAFGTLAG